MSRIQRIDSFFDQPETMTMNQIETTARELTFAQDNFDTENTFNLEVRGFKAMKSIKVSLHLNYHTRDDGIVWAMKHSVTMKSHYSAEDIAERNRLNSEEPVRNGDIVRINCNELGGDKLYRVRVLGDFSNCAIFDPVEAE